MRLKISKSNEVVSWINNTVKLGKYSFQDLPKFSLMSCIFEHSGLLSKI